MALATEKCLFLHIPKTGGLWLRHIFKICNIKHYEIADQHSHFPYLLKFNSPDFYKNLFIFTFVRHPVYWYQSRWAFRIKHGWKAQHPLDYNCASNDFHEFVEKAIKYKPNGWVTWEYLNYIDEVPKPIDFIGRAENIVDDCITALRMAGEEIDERLIKRTPRINDSDLEGKSSKYWATYTPELLERILLVEQEVIRRYYADYHINPNSLCNPLPY